MSDKNYIPKGGMCAKCRHKHANCQGLDFSAMKVIGNAQINQDGNLIDYKIVACIEYRRENQLV